MFINNCVERPLYFCRYPVNVGKIKMKVSLARTTLVNEPDKYGETIAVVCEHLKGTQEMLFADRAQ